MDGRLNKPAIRSNIVFIPSPILKRLNLMSDDSNKDDKKTEKKSCDRFGIADVDIPPIVLKGNRTAINEGFENARDPDLNEILKKINPTKKKDK